MSLWGDQSWYDHNKDGKLTGWEKTSWMAKQADEENQVQFRAMPIQELSSATTLSPGLKLLNQCCVQLDNSLNLLWGGAAKTLNPQLQKLILYQITLAAQQPHYFIGFSKELLKNFFQLYPSLGSVSYVLDAIQAGQVLYQHSCVLTSSECGEFWRDLIHIALDHATSDKEPLELHALFNSLSTISAVFGGEDIEAAQYDMREAFSDHLSEAEVLTDDILNRLDKYISDLDDLSYIGPFNGSGIKFEKEHFQYDKKPPEKHGRRIVVVSEQPWTIKIENFEAEYEANVAQYEAEKQSAMEQWNIEQERLAEEFNRRIEADRKLYAEKDPVGVERYVRYLFEACSFGSEIINRYTVGYRPQSGRAVLEIYMKPLHEIVFLGVRTIVINAKIRSLIQTVALSAVDRILCNDDANAVSDLVTNIYLDDICCMSVQVEKETYLRYDLLDPATREAFLICYARQSEALTTGVIPYEVFHQTE